MLLMIIGLVVFLGLHSSRIVAEDYRQRFIAERGENTWKGVYSILSLIGFVLIIIGYGQARQSPTLLWLSPVWLSHLNALLMVAVFVLLAAAYVPANHIRSAVGHPMVLGVKLWAFGHLLANGELGSVVLFGSFLAWAVADYIAARRRDRSQDLQKQANGKMTATLLTVGIGLVAWIIFAGWLHRWLIGVSAFGGI